MAIPLACLAFTRYVLGRADPVADNVAANVVGLTLGTFARFWAIRSFIFPTRLPVPEQPGELAVAER